MKSSKQFVYLWLLNQRLTEGLLKETDLSFENSTLMPFLTKFASASDIWDSKDCAIGLQKRENSWTKKWVN